jgi:hypothetical protein
MVDKLLRHSSCTGTTCTAAPTEGQATHHSTCRCSKHSSTSAGKLQRRSHFHSGCAHGGGGQHTAPAADGRAHGSTLLCPLNLLLC